MSKNTKTIKILIITLSAFMVIFLALLAAPFIFKNQIMEFAKNELNKMLLAKVEFQDLKLSFIRSFPDAHVVLEGLEVTGTDDFEGELLAAFDRFSVTADIMSVIRMEKIEIKSILLDRARLNGHILEDGRANWNIIKPAEVKEEEVPEEAAEEEVAAEEKTPEEEPAPVAFSIGLNKFEIRNMEITFRDDINKMIAEVQKLNYILHGDMTRDEVDLNMDLNIDGIDFWLDGIRLANKVNIGFISEVAADLKNMIFTVKDNQFNLNEITLKFDGSVEMVDDDIKTNITYASDRVDFKSLLSLVPAIYMKDFQDVRTTGSLVLNGDIKGTFNDKMMPNVNLNLSVDNAMFKYPDLPKSVDKININARVHYNGEVFDRTTVDVDRLNFEMAGNPFNAALHLRTPESDLQFSAKFAGKIDFDSVRDIIPLDDVTLNGLLECDLSLAGKMSSLEKERYEEFEAAGILKLTGFDFESPDFPQGVKITRTQLNFNPRRVELVNFDAVIGRSDVEMNGSLENFLPFILRGDTVKGTLTLKSNTIDLNEFMSDKPAEEKPADTGEKTAMSVIEVPKNINFAMNVNIGTILFDKLTITNTVGALSVRDGRLVMQNLGMNLLDGSMVLQGEYNTQNAAVPFIDFDMNIRQFDVASAVESFSIVETILPEARNYVGKVSARMNMHSIMDEQLSPVLSTVASKGNLQTHNLELRNSQLFGTMATFLNNERLRTPALNNTNIRYEIRGGRLYIEDPIIMNLPQTRVELKGDQGLDMTLNYRLDAFVPTSAIGPGATNVLSNLPAGITINEVKITGLIQGTAKNPEIKLSVADMVSSITTAVRDQVVERATQVVDEVRTQVNEEINRQIEALMAEANRQAANIRAGAKQAADRVRQEANDAADRLVREAAGRSVIERQAAQVAANGLRREGETNAQRVEQEGERQVKTVLDAAQARANELRRN